MKKGAFNLLFLALISFGCWLNSPGIQSVFHVEIHKLQGLPCETGSQSSDHQDCLIQSALASLLVSLDFESGF
ncbi:MAG: hypothetical protein AABZ31_06570, partial [Bdellovibrionota bacterium]